MTEQEREVIQQIADEENTEVRNVLRRAMRCLMEARGMEVAEDLFSDRSRGNPFPKSAALPTVEANRAGTTTVVSAPSLAIAIA